MTVFSFPTHNFWFQRIILLVICFFIFNTVSLAQYPSLPIDFEASSINYQFNAFGGVSSNGLLSNPDNSGVNLSSQVWSMTKNPWADTWGGITFPLSQAIDFSMNTAVEIKVYSPRAGVPILFKIEDNTSPPDANGNPSIQSSMTVNTTVANTWEILTFDFALNSNFVATNNYNQIVMFPDFGTAGIAGGETYYFDDFENTAAPILSLPVDFESAALSYSFNSFGGVNSNGIINNPVSMGINTSPQIWSISKTDGAETWGGVAYPLNFNVDFSMNSILEFKIYSPRAGVPILFKVEDTTSPPDADGNPSIASTVYAYTTVANIWETLYFDFGLNGNFSNTNTYNQLVVFPDFGTVGVTGGETYYIDDIANTPPLIFDTDCPDTTNLVTYVHAIDSVLHADSLIQSNALIQSPSAVIYYAGSNICLDNGFQVDLGADFIAAIDADCALQQWYKDADGDGLGNPYEIIVSSVQPTGYVSTPLFNTGYSTPISQPGYNLVWSDEFKGTSLDLNNWGYDLGDGCPNVCGWGNNEVIWYQTNNATVADDFLTIEAREENAGGYNYTSSRIKSKDLQDFQYGRIDIRAKLPYSQGIWPALWMLGSNFDTVGWPSCGEIDIMELVGGIDPITLENRDKRVHGTLHWEQNGYASFGGSYALPAGIFNDQFHVFSIIWDATSIQWFVDDIHYLTIDITPSGLSEFHNTFFFIFNVAVGGNWPGNPDGTSVFPQQMIVDYVRVFQ